MSLEEKHIDQEQEVSQDQLFISEFGQEKLLIQI